MALTPHICTPPPGAQGLGSEGLGAMGCRSGHRPPCCSLGSPLSVWLGGAGGGDSLCPVPPCSAQPRNTKHQLPALQAERSCSGTEPVPETISLNIKNNSCSQY